MVVRSLSIKPDLDGPQSLPMIYSCGNPCECGSIILNNMSYNFSRIFSFSLVIVTFGVIARYLIGEQSAISFGLLYGHNSGNTYGAVVSENDVCTKIGLEFLIQGGNAADAVCFSSKKSMALLMALLVDWDCVLFRGHG